MQELPGFDEQAVLAFVNELHETNPTKRTFTLAEIAEAMHGPGSAAIAQGSVVGSDGQTISQPAIPAWMEALNNILKKLGQEGQLRVTTTAVVLFPSHR